MMKLTVPKSQQVSFVSKKIYYVSSEQNPSADPYIVVRIGRVEGTIDSRKFFCNCKDFMIRRLVGTAISTYRQSDADTCKHGDFVRRMENVTPFGYEVIEAVSNSVTKFVSFR